MIVTGSQHSNGITIVLNPAEAARLAAVLASGKGQDIDQAKLREDVLREIGLRIFASPDWYKRLAFATENRPVEHQMGIVKLFERANAIPAIRAEANGVLKSCATTLSNLIEKAGPRAATPYDMAHRKEGR
jgi:hypothetical protein